MAKTLKEMVAEAKERVTEFGTAETEEQIHKFPNTLLLDVREPGEVAAGHLPNALPVPRGMLEAKADLDYKHREPRLADRNQPVVVYCASGVRSLLAADTLQQMGFTNVKSMAGGFAAWKEEGREVVSESW